DRTDLLRSATVRTELLDSDLPADELLVDRLCGPLHVGLRERVLRRRGLPVADGRADRKRQRHRLDDPVEEELALRRLQLLRVLFGIRERPQVGLDLLAQRREHGLEPRALEDGGEAELLLSEALDV